VGGTDSTAGQAQACREGIQIYQGSKCTYICNSGYTPSAASALCPATGAALPAIPAYTCTQGTCTAITGIANQAPIACFLRSALLITAIPQDPKTTIAAAVVAADTLDITELRCTPNCNSGFFPRTTAGAPLLPGTENAYVVGQVLGYLTCAPQVFPLTALSSAYGTAATFSCAAATTITGCTSTVTVGALVCTTANGDRPCPTSGTQSCYEGFTVEKGAAAAAEADRYTAGFSCQPVCPLGAFPRLDVAACAGAQLAGAALAGNVVKCVELLDAGAGSVAEYWYRGTAVAADNKITTYVCCASNA